jgi:hypothetical protein
MRTRKEIEESKEDRYCVSTRNYEASRTIASDLILEVLLDIRDLLNRPQ